MEAYTDHAGLVLEGADLVLAEMPTAEQFRDEARAIQASVLEGLNESVKLGWMSQEDADIQYYSWLVQTGLLEVEQVDDLAAENQ